ncbi:338_t:CDS:2 [Ambispora gerdemannii]|uniref:338_t:CDS:1 n=1 Tax=Ambispora gerdemannii TaxID=144530 RepID=A0A9N9EHE1_9GLOM|nr:338_t:CDS:2 [Ambispora gerdemannii]
MTTELLGQATLAAHYKRRLRLDDNVTKKGVVYELEQLIHGRPEIHVYNGLKRRFLG